MFLAGDTLDVVTESIYIIFNCSIDFGLYWLINITFDVFFVLARLDIFGATPLGMELYDSLSQRIYMIISIVMVFIFAYNLLLYVMRPDGEYVSKNLKPTLLLKRITFSMVLIIMTPLIFRYMSTFQNHVLASDAIPSLILGREQGTTRVMSKGEKISMMTWMTFIHPRNKTYGDYINDFDADTCGQYFVDPNNANFTVSEQAFVQALIDNCSDGGGFKTTKIVKNAKSWKSDDIEKLPIISSIAAVMLLVFGIGYVYSIAGRIFRLFVLQIFAPVPIMMRIFNKEKNFDPWLKDLMNTYLDVFIRVAVISFILFMCTVLPDIINSVNDAVLQEIIFGG